MCVATVMFDMFQLQEFSVVIYALADALFHFEWNGFAPAFISLMKSEIPKTQKDIWWRIFIRVAVSDFQMCQNRDEMRNQNKYLTRFHQKRSINKGKKSKVARKDASLRIPQAGKVTWENVIKSSVNSGNHVRLKQASFHILQKQSVDQCWS